MSYCSSRTLVKTEGLNKVALAVRCRSWLCPDCYDTRKRQLMAQGMGGRPSTFFTCTTRRIEGQDPNIAARELARAWRILRLRILRHKRWKVLPFLAVMEKHKSGWPHLHVIARCAFIDWHWLKEQWLEITGSPGIRIELIRGGQRVAAYVAKYCGKAAHKFDTAKRYWRSRDYDLRPKPAQTFAAAERDGWVMVPEPFVVFVHNHLCRGYRATHESRWRATLRPT